MIEIGITVFLIILSTILFIIILIFLIPELIMIIKKKLVERFFLGRILDEQLWGEKVRSVCQKWLLKTPKVSKTDSRSFWIIEKIKNKSKDSIQVWQSASLYCALNEYYQKTRSIVINNNLDEFKNVADIRYDLNAIEDSDFGMLAFALIDDSRFDRFTNAMLDYVNKSITDEGIIPYKMNTKQTAFVDTLAFICPFLVKCGVKFGESEYIELAKKQIKLYFQYGIEKNSGLPFHAFSVDSHIQRGICDWARGLAWLLIGMMDSYKALLSAGLEDEFFRTSIKKYADILVDYQKENGSFTWQLLSGYTTDSSAIAVFGWYLACCYKIFDEAIYLERADKCRTFLMMQTRNNGIIDYCQGDTIGIGVYSRSFDIMPFAQGFALRMQVELESLG